MDLKAIGTLFIVSLLMSCADTASRPLRIAVKNSLSYDRSNETVSLKLEALGSKMGTGKIEISEPGSGTVLVTQLLDSDNDGTMDEVLFQPKVAANSEAIFEVTLHEKTNGAETPHVCYSRFVPERTDDYAWENDRVAFRTFGPTAQRMNEEGVPGGTLSSGIDAWLKRVDYPIIDKWYHKELQTEGTYHEDNGEGLDNFHVGISRGVGGTAKKVDSIYAFSKNFTDWNTLYTGPIRTGFTLTYADWDANGKKIREVKKITLDRGSNLSRFEISVTGTDTLSAGLTLHEKDGLSSIDEKQGWLSYWEPHGDSELGTAIIVPDGKMIGHENYDTELTDASNLFAHIEATGGKIIYYSGFGWKKSGQFADKEDWERYVSRFSELLRHPLEVRVK